ncbi:MAG: hypothetical protein IKP23_05750 [Elusimicrobiaceae bacterium]|nr:hypothetical protein [Elusimicrobiaceae bacterium]
MKAFKILVGVIVFFILAALIGLAWQWLFAQFMPSDLYATLTELHTFGVRSLKLSLSVCGLLGMICSYGLCTYTIKL